MKSHKNIIVIIFISLSGLFISSCEKVIDIDLKNAESRLVIEGRVTTDAGPYQVSLSTSGGYFDTTAIKPVNNAQVSLSNESGDTEILTEIEPGIYQTQNFICFEDNWYELNVDVDGETYSAEAYLPKVITITSMDVVKSNFIGFGNDGDSLFDVKILFTDPIETSEYYMFSVYRNGILDVSNFRPYAISDDILFNGLTFVVTIPRVTALPGDEIYVELHSIGFNTYEYFRTLNEVIGGGMGSTPYNPITNLSNGALGYFGSYATDSDSKVIE